MAESENLDGLARRFEEATDLLNQLAETISRLKNTEESRQQIASSVEQSNTQLQLLSEKIEQVVSEMSVANENLSQTFHAAQEFLAGTDLTQMQNQISETDAKNDKIIEMLETSLKESQSELSDIREEKANLQTELESLKAKVATLSDRLRKKLDLS